MSEYPKCHAWQNGQGITVDFGHHDWKEIDKGEGICYIANTNIRALHAVLTEKVAEMDAKRWFVQEDEYNPAIFEVRRGDDGPIAVQFWQATCPDAYARASALVHQLNEAEGLP